MASVNAPRGLVLARKEGSGSNSLSPGRMTDILSFLQNYKDCLT